MNFFSNQYTRLMSIVSKRVLIIGGIILSLVLAAVIVVVLLSRNNINLSFQGQVQVYFFSPTDGALLPEDRPRPQGNQDEWIFNIMWSLMIGPNSNRLTSVWPPHQNPEIEDNWGIWKGWRMEDDTLVLNFDESYFLMQPLQEALFRSAVTLTMTGLGFVEEVRFVVGEAELTESSITIANAPELSPARISNTQLILYYLDASGEGLVRELYEAIDVDTNPQMRPRVALERLIEGTYAEGSINLIPPETRVRAVIRMPETNSIYVNLSGDFLSRFTGGPVQANIVIKSIVNTVLANSSGLRQVFFLIDSARVDSFHGVPYFSHAFEYDPTVMLDYVPPEELEESMEDN